MHYADLSLCDYHRGPHDASEWHSPLLAIGWLEEGHPYSTGRTAPELLEKLQALMSASWEQYPSYAFRGLHACTLCQGDTATLLKRSLEVCSHENLWIPGDGVIYIAPGMITHYVGNHEYQPPAEFIHAVMCCPEYGPPAYCAALRAANADHPPPLLTKEENAAKWAQELEEMHAARRIMKP